MTESQATNLPVPHIDSLSNTPDNPSTLGSDEPDSIPSASVSEFQSFIPSVPWQPIFWPGAGINAFTGQVEPQAVVPFTLTPSEKKQSREYFRTIRYESNLMQEQFAAAGAGITLNIGQVGLGADATLLSQARVSATSSSTLATYTTTYDWDFDPTSEYQLKPAAAELARDKPEEFRGKYGDYFIAGGQRTSSFTALLVYTCVDMEMLEKFAANVTTSLHDLFKVIGSAKWADDAKKANVEVKVYVEMRGYIGNAPTASGSWDASKVADALDWFKQHEVGNYSVARLQHYSTLDPNIPRTMPISGEIFRDIRRLNVLLRSVSILSESCPGTGSRESATLVANANELCQDIASVQWAFVVDSGLCARYLKAADVLHYKLTAVHQRYLLWVRVANKIQGQPLQRINAAKNQQIWSYGFSTLPSGLTTQILSTEHRLALPWSLSPFPRHGTLSYAGERLIVGWKVISVRKDGHNGSWRRLANSILLSNSARIVFRTEPFRSAEWKLVVYHVDPKLYDFSVGIGHETYTPDDSDRQTPSVSPRMALAS